MRKQRWMAIIFLGFIGIASLIFFIGRLPFLRAQTETSPAMASPATAVIQAGNKNYSLQNKVDDQFDRVYIEAGQTVTTEISFPDGNKGDNIVLNVEDGGSLEGGARVRQISLDAQGKASFQFTAGADHGIYRISIYKTDASKIINSTKILTFWVGEPLPIAAPSSS